MFNEVLSKTKLDQLCLYLHEECIRVIFFNVLLFLFFRWNKRKIKKDFLKGVSLKNASEVIGTKGGGFNKRGRFDRFAEILYKGGVIIK